MERHDTSDDRGKIDWERAHERLARAEAALVAADDPPLHEVRRVLRERAVRLAAPIAVAEGREPVDLVIFRAGNGRYAIDSGQASAVLPATPTPLPGVPAFYLGLIMHRGMVSPLVDIGPLLGAPRAERPPAGYAILCSVNDDVIAIAADSIEGFVRFDAGELAGAAEGMDGHLAIRGMTRDAVIIIDAARLLRDARLTVDEQPLIYGGTSGRQSDDPALPR